MARTLYTNFRWAVSGEAQEMLTDSGRVVDRGPALGSVAGAERVDLGGRQLLPGFVDAHCHILPTGLDLKKLHLGRAGSHEEVLDLVSDRHAHQPDGWLEAVHYDHNKYGGAHLCRAQLDKISPTRPILLEHVNAHASVANTAALMAAKVTEDTPDPAGGAFGRGEDGLLNGLLLETAHQHVQRATPAPTMDEMVEAIVAAGKLMRSQGICCASDMTTGWHGLVEELEAYRLAIAKGCPIHMRLYVQWKNVFGPRAVPGALALLQEYGLVGSAVDDKPTCRVAGVKIFSDGAIASATAAIYGRFMSSERGLQPASGSRASARSETDGKLIYTSERLNEMVLTAHEAGLSVATHAIGDYATDLVMDAYEATDEPSRHRIEHAMIMSDAQISRMSGLGCQCAFQPEFLMRLGPAYRRQLGDERAARLIRVRSALDAGVKISFSSDRPIVGGDPWDGIRTACERPSGFDPSENCTVAEAVSAYSEAGSAANGEPKLFGSLLPGSVAEFQVVDRLPV